MEGEKNKSNGDVHELNINNRSMASPANNPPDIALGPQDPKTYSFEIRGRLPHDTEDVKNKSTAERNRRKIDTPEYKPQWNYSLEELQRQESGRRNGAIQHEPPRRTRMANTGRHRSEGPFERPQLFHNYYEQVQLRKQKIAGFLQKDLCQINRPDLRAFLNRSHAIECLLPYHVFSPMIYEDLLFTSTRACSAVEDELRMAMEQLRDAMRLERKHLVMEKSLVVDLLLYYEQRYMNTICMSGREDAQPQERPRQKKNKGVLNKRNTILRLKYAPEDSEGNHATIRNGKLRLKKVPD
jgi:hypothetical protein